MHVSLLATDLREKIRQRRRKLNETEKIEASAKIVAQLIQHPVLLHSQKIAGYLATDGEVNLCTWFEKAWQQSKECYLPVMIGKKLLFAHYAQDTKLQLNRWNILEPITKNLIEPEKLDVAILPIVAFDSNGHRIGRGSGYYDQSFAFTQKLSNRKKTYLIGVAYAFQKISLFIPKAWDIPMNTIITDLERLNYDPSYNSK